VAGRKEQVRAAWRSGVDGSCIDFPACPGGRKFGDATSSHDIGSQVGF
jgi:hypothetical protein